MVCIFSPYEHGNIFNVEPMRPRKLLMHKKEIMRLLGKFQRAGADIGSIESVF